MTAAVPLIVALFLMLMGHSDARPSGTQRIGTHTEQLLTLAVGVDERSMSYSFDRDGTKTVFVDGPYHLIVTLGNATNHTVSMRPGRQDWSESVRFTARPVETVNGMATDRADIKVSRASTRSSIRSVEAKRMVSDPYTIVSSRPLDVGEYLFTVEIDESELSQEARQYRNLLRREIRLRVAKPTNDTEIVEQLLQLSSRAMASRQFAQAREIASRVYRLNPDSIPAMSDVANAYLKEGNCVAAKPVLQRMIDILDSGRDAELAVSKPARQELAWAIRGQISKSCP
jgi:hypothetical protein